MAEGDLADQLRSHGVSDRVIAPGQVYQLHDEDISFPETSAERKQGKGTHDSRYAIVVQGDDSLTDPTHARVLVVPTSASSLDRDPKPRYGIPILRGNGNVPSDCLALVDHVQPVLKVRLKNLCGPLEPATYEQVQAVLLRVLGHF
ncbi:MAG: type II toxin-antitoxin system PemK/MazF family toxin [Coriobacteriia bacterium]|nr:type II toxin-antitoxin system PemK/MazF family toxin [Coriobacteriia bacterium]